jgi:FlaA1/EpsC-like NDP-sugar epimerase
MRVSGKYRPVCFFDDDRTLNNRNVAGLKVFHSDRLIATVHHRRIGLIVIAIPSASAEQRRDIMYQANKAGVPVKILCGLMELADEEITAQSIREIKIDDLLGREPIRPVPELFARCVQDQNILVTGAGGSIGSELCRQIMTVGPKRLHVLDHSEHALYHIEQELRRQFPGLPIQPHLGSVCDARLVDRLMDEGSIDTVYHAAAYKHVPLVEDNMAEGIRNNVLGAEVVANAAAKHRVKTCVLVSTDKAVRPTSIMGASKRIAELVFQAAAINAARGVQGSAETIFCMVRFGNVLGSSGSVVPLFKGQIERGGPITITHREVVRYFMSISEAAQLVMQAGAMATGGDVFVMDMGEQVKIVDLARTMIAMSGLTEKSKSNPDGDIGIKYVGLRPGEKLYEELFAGDNAIPSKHPRIMTTTEYVVDPDVLSQQIAYLMVACSTNDKAMIRFLVQKLVKGYAPNMPGDVIPEDALPEEATVPPQQLLHYALLPSLDHNPVRADA